MWFCCLVKNFKPMTIFQTRTCRNGNKKTTIININPLHFTRCKFWLTHSVSFLDHRIEGRANMNAWVRTVTCARHYRLSEIIDYWSMVNFAFIANWFIRNQIWSVYLNSKIWWSRNQALVSVDQKSKKHSLTKREDLPEQNAIRPDITLKCVDAFKETFRGHPLHREPGL